MKVRTRKSGCLAYQIPSQSTAETPPCHNIKLLRRVLAIKPDHADYVPYNTQACATFLLTWSTVPVVLLSTSTLRLDALCTAMMRSSTDRDGMSSELCPPAPVRERKHTPWFTSTIVAWPQRMAGSTWCLRHVQSVFAPAKEVHAIVSNSFVARLSAYTVAKIVLRLTRPAAFFVRAGESKDAGTSARDRHHCGGVTYFRL